MTDEMNPVVGELWEQLFEIEDVVGEVVVAARADPFGLSVASPIERRDAMTQLDELTRDGIEAPRDVQKAMTKNDVDGLVAPDDDVVSKPVRRDRIFPCPNH
jgi:hypothetical protein